MKRYLRTAVIVGLIFAGAATAVPSPGETQRLKAKWSAGVNGDEQMSHGFRMSPMPSNAYSNQFLLKKMDQLYEEIAQEVEEAEQRHEEYEVLLQENENYYSDMDKQLKGIMLRTLKQMYDQAMAQNIVHLYSNSKHDKERTEIEGKTEMERMIDRFLHDKIRSAMLQSLQHEPTTYDDHAASTSVHHEHQAHVMTDQSPVNYIPIYKFDGASGDYCYPDWPSADNNNKCKSLNPNAPVFYEVDTCDGQTVYTYWLWYGLQQPCILNQGTHGNDWEDVSVYVNPSDGLVSKVVYHQHFGHYTRRRGTYQAKGERPIVYVGKQAHGSYHSDCNGRCSWSEFINYGCYGSVRYCLGGCGYWDDFRNPGPELRDPVLYPLQEGQTIDGIERPDRDVCGLDTCRGLGYRSLLTSGCWQDEP